MKIMKAFNVIILQLFFLGLTSCCSNEDILIGKKKIEGSDDLYVSFYQKDECERLLSITYAVVNENDEILTSKYSFKGTDVRLKNVEEIHPVLPVLYDSILYICYPYPIVYTIRHLNHSAYESEMGRDTLFNKLKTHDSKLVDKWRIKGSVNTFISDSL